MRNLIFVVGVVVLMTAVPLHAQDARTVEIDGVVMASPCVRNPAEACIDILVYPKVHMEVYRFGDEKGEKVAVVDVPEQSGKLFDGKFKLQLTPDKYLLYIENKLNGQVTTFGPITIEEDVKQMQVSIVTYNSYSSDAPNFEDREICITNKILTLTDASIDPGFSLFPEMKCNLDTYKKSRYGKLPSFNKAD